MPGPLPLTFPLPWFERAFSSRAGKTAMHKACTALPSSSDPHIEPDLSQLVLWQRLSWSQSQLVAQLWQNNPQTAAASGDQSCKVAPVTPRGVDPGTSPVSLTWPDQGRCCWHAGRCCGHGCRQGFCRSLANSSSPKGVHWATAAYQPTCSLAVEAKWQHIWSFAGAVPERAAKSTALARRSSPLCS